MIRDEIIDPSEVKIKIIRSDGLVFVIGEDWKIPSEGLENWAQLEYDVSVEEYAGNDGGVLSNNRVKSVDRSITAEYTGELANCAAARRAAISFFSPKNNYACYITYLGQTMWCSGYQYAFKCSTQNVFSSVTIDWTIICPMPYLQGVDNFGLDLAQNDGRFGFPAHIVTSSTVKGVYKRGGVFGRYEHGDKVDIDNDGDVETYCTVKITPHAALEAPKISIGEKFVKVDTTLEAGDELLIDFTSVPPIVTINGESAISLVDIKSNFTDFVIPTGKSTFVFSAVGGAETATVFLYFYKRYLGI